MVEGDFDLSIIWDDVYVSPVRGKRLNIDPSDGSLVLSISEARDLQRALHEILPLDNAQFLEQGPMTFHSDWKLPMKHHETDKTWPLRTALMDATENMEFAEDRYEQEVNDYERAHSGERPKASRPPATALWGREDINSMWSDNFGGESAETQPYADALDEAAKHLDSMESVWNQAWKNYDQAHREIKK